MIRYAFVVFLFISIQSYCQEGIITYCKKCYETSGKKLVRNLPLPSGAQVVVKRNGSFGVSFGHTWIADIKGAGRYSIDSIQLITVRIRDRDDSIYMELLKRGLGRCNFKYLYTLAPGSYNGHVELGHIELGNHRTYAVDSVVRITWKHPEVYTGEYVVVIMNLWEEYEAIYTTSNSYLDLPTSIFSKDTALMYRVISEECRASENGLIFKGPPPTR